MAVTISLAITQNSQNITDNTSNVTVKATVSWTGGSFNATGKCTGSITIDGTKYSFSGLKFNTGRTTTGSQTIMTKTVDVEHNTDGTKTLSCSTSFVTGVSSGTITASASKALTTIPRKSVLSTPNGTLGVRQELIIVKQNPNFTHTIKYTCGSASGTVCTKLKDDHVPFLPPEQLARQNTTGTSVSVKLTITTYSGDKNIGSYSKTITCAIPDTEVFRPSCKITVKDAAGYSVYIKGKSKFKITVTPTTAWGSDIVSYSVKANGVTYTTNTVTTGVLASSGSLTITATVKDERGRTAKATKTVTVYDKSTINNVSYGPLSAETWFGMDINIGSSAFTHDITYKCGTVTKELARDFNKTPLNFQMPLSLAEQNTTGTNLPVTFTLTTYCDGKVIGTSKETYTYTVPPEVKPSVKISVEDSTGFDSAFGNMIKGHSKLSIQLALTPSYGADIVSISTSVLGVKYNETLEPGVLLTTFDAGTVTKAGGFTITTTVTDERGRTGKATYDIAAVLDYSPPKISQLTVGRCNEDGTPNGEGTHISVTYGASVTDLNGENFAHCKVQYKKTSASSYTTGEYYNESGSFSGKKFIFPAETGSSYNVLLTVDDQFETTTKSTTASTAFTIMHFHKDGQGMAIGKVSEDKTKDYLDMGIHTVMQNNKYLCGMSLTTKDDTRAPTPVRMLYLNANNNTILGYGGYYYGYGTTNIYGQRIHLGVKLGGVKDGAAAFFKPYYEKGDVITDVTWTGAGFVSTKKTVIYFSIPLSKPIATTTDADGNEIKPTIVISSAGGGIRARQNDNYTHGSNTEEFAVPASYTANANSGNHIQIAATMNATDNAINNAPIGVQWKGTITFE